MDAPDFLYHLDLRLVAGVGFLGWCLAAYCIWNKHQIQKETKPEGERENGWHLFNALLKASFTSITMVAALHLTVNVAIHLPEVLGRSEDRVETAIDQASTDTVTAVGDACEGVRRDVISTIHDLRDPLTDAEEERDEIIEILKRVEEVLQPVEGPGFADEAWSLREDEGLEGEALANRLAELAERHLRGQRVELVDSRLHFRFLSREKPSSFTIWIQGDALKASVHD